MGAHTQSTKNVKMSMKSPVPGKHSWARMHAYTHTHTHKPSYVELQHQSVGGPQPPPFASAHAVGLPETLEQREGCLNPYRTPSSTRLRKPAHLETQDVTYQSEPPGGAAPQAAVGTWPPPHRSAAPETQLLQPPLPPASHPASPCSLAGSFSEGQLEEGKGQGGIGSEIPQ